MSESVVEGAKAPNFTLPDQEGKPVKLSDYQGKKIVLYFYPKDDTPGCTKEACGFRDSFSVIKQKGAVILGVSRDDQNSHQKFISKYSLPFTLLSDKEAEVSKTYGVYKLKNQYGREYWGIERSTFIIDEQGKIKKAFRGVKVDNHTQEVLQALES
ncbi:MAG: thioredoxin-dependent thiol peroxidase [Thaumarchaeota archaeon]|nr:thioredoxin-dependent thiol peroxidase [Nitrososphaerota archaeon]